LHLDRHHSGSKETEDKPGIGNGVAVISCTSCNMEISENQAYAVEGKVMCENCALKAGLYPLGHTGARRDRISEKGRCLTLPKPDES
jgi:hypothetical protein